MGASRAPDEPTNQDRKRYWRFYAMSAEREDSVFPNTES